ncbi:MAG: bifunctional riboflavin kinase/FAD synthetase [Saprospiraceae bacterium]|jgi:riboflavin kinase/FMN adenylyltransferase|nr:bifunctional riboflavin kinase/FAD synthetase [Saprospiraceae bacterium]
MNIYKNINDLPAFKNPVITIGSFDGVHAGHQKILLRVKTLADEINGESVVITFFPHPRKIIDPREQGLSVLNTLDEKIEQISSLGIGNIVIVPFTFEFSRLSPREYIEKFIIGCFHPKYIVIGYDHKFGLNRAGDIHLFKDYENKGHFHVIEIPRQEVDEVTVSSTKIRSAILTGKIEDASLLLNHPYVLTGKVIHGDKLGTKLGYPTANLYISEKEKLIPMEGVYAVKTEIEGEEFNGMMYIGKKPTVSEQAGINIEINIFDFNQNIYDKTIKINIIKYLRNDIKFDTLDQLKEQLAIDEKNALIALDSLKTFEKKYPIVTVAILNYNGSELLESYLPMIEFSSEKYEFDILVIDNKSEDLSIDFVKEWYPEIRVAELSKNYGFADGYNKGLKDVQTDYVVIINSDVLVTENWLDPIIEAFETDKELGIVQPMILSIEDKTKFEYAGAAGGYIDVFGYPFCRGRIFNHIESNENQYDDDAEIFWASGAALVCRTKVFKSLGGFDGSFFAHQEEIDLCWRFRQAGYNIKCISASKVYHLGGGTLDYNNPKKDFLNFRNNLYLLTKNEHLINLLWLIPAKLILDGVAGMKFLLDGKFRSTIAIIKAHMSYYKHLPLVFERRNLEQNLIFRNKINKPDLNGIFFGSIVWKYYIERIKKFTDLNF